MLFLNAVCCILFNNVSIKKWLSCKMHVHVYPTAESCYFTSIRQGVSQDIHGIYGFFSDRHPCLIINATCIHIIHSSISGMSTECIIQVVNKDFYWNKNSYFLNPWRKRKYVVNTLYQLITIDNSLGPNKPMICNFVFASFCCIFLSFVCKHFTQMHCLKLYILQALFFLLCHV